MKYYVWLNYAPNVKNWVRCKKASEISKGWLEYELRDGTTGLMRPGKWKKE